MLSISRSLQTLHQFLIHLDLVHALEYLGWYRSKGFRYVFGDRGTPNPSSDSSSWAYGLVSGSNKGRGRNLAALARLPRGNDLCYFIFG